MGIDCSMKTTLRIASLMIVLLVLTACDGQNGLPALPDFTGTEIIIKPSESPQIESEATGGVNESADPGLSSEANTPTVKTGAVVLTTVITSTAVPLPETGQQATQTPIPELFESTLTVTSVPCNQAAAGVPIDVTIPDGSVIQPNQAFTKVWRLVNTGSCAWTEGYSLIWFSGTSMSGSLQENLQTRVEPGSPVDITVEMMAPGEVGVYQSNWKLQDSQGNLFGIGPNGDSPIWVRIEVLSNDPTQTPEPVATPTNEGVFNSQNDVALVVGDGLDLDGGTINSGETDDIRFSVVDTGSYLAAVGSASIALYGMQPPSMAECVALADAVDGGTGEQELTGLNDGAYMCYRSGDGRPGYLILGLNSLAEKSLGLDFVTWALP